MITRGGRHRIQSFPPNGRYMAFQIARTSDEAGVGYGIVLMRLAN